MVLVNRITIQFRSVSLGPPDTIDRVMFTR